MPEWFLQVLDRVLAPENMPGLIAGVCALAVLAGPLVDWAFAEKPEELKLEPSDDDIPDDTCMCGDAMENHDSPLNCGHSPVSMRAYYLRDRE